MFDPTEKQKKDILYWLSMGATNLQVSIELGIDCNELIEWVVANDEDIKMAKQKKEWEEKKNRILIKNKVIDKISEVKKVKDAQWYATHDKELREEWGDNIKTEVTGKGGQNLGINVIVFGEKDKLSQHLNANLPPQLDSGASSIEDITEPCEIQDNSLAS
jgi:hypothetical protein